MTERPIPFSAPMVRAILDGTKTQTRRLVKPKRPPDGHWMVETRGTSHELTHWDNDQADTSPIECPYGQPGDRLWVREAWRAELTWDTTKPSEISDEAALWYEADDQQRNNGRGAKFKGKLRPGMFMPRWASRITLEITSVRVERLQDISEADAKAEGAEEAFNTDKGYEAHPLGNHQEGFAKLWTEINGHESWEANPWVWVVEFTRTK